MTKPVSFVELSCQLRFICVWDAAVAARFDGAAGTPEETAVSLSQLKLPVYPLIPSVSNARRSTCWPADNWTGTLMVVQVCQAPVLGTLNVPVLFTPLDSTWNVPPAPSEATRRSNV